MKFFAARSKGGYIWTTDDRTFLSKEGIELEEVPGVESIEAVSAREAGNKYREKYQLWGDRILVMAVDEYAEEVLPGEEADGEVWFPAASPRVIQA